MSDVNQRRAVREAERQRRASRSRKTSLTMMIGAGVLLVAMLALFFVARPIVSSFLADKDYPGPGTGSVQVSVPDGATGSVIAKVLQQSDVIKTSKAFIDAANKDSRAKSIQPGVYTLKKQMTAAGALDVLADPANRVVKKVTVKEGQRLVEILASVAKDSGLSAASLNAAAKDFTAIGLPAEAKGRLEGWLFPATYEISPTTTAPDLLSSMVSKTVEQLTELGVPRTQWNAVLIEASMVEAERGSDPADAAKIARVFDNRMAAKRPLQLDTTVNYALNRRKVAVSIADTKVDSPYNTYKVVGLPIGAICSPGVVAIQAVLDPTPGPWLYFVAVDPDTGETKYATTEAEFFALQAELNAWIKAHPGR